MNLSKKQVDLILRRNIGDGVQFEKYIDKTDGTNENLGKGDTLHGVLKMKAWVLKYYKQVSRLAKLLQTPSIETTCDNIKKFLFLNIQYSKDSELQQLRSPSNSWENRKAGIDCKSYSVFASAILTNLGIIHYIRRIKQRTMNSDKFSHVYVIIPINQITGDLKDGHYAIDGTIRSNNEPRYKEKDDLIMEKLPYIGLNGVAKTPRKTTKKTSKTPPKKAVTKITKKQFPFN